MIHQPRRFTALSAICVYVFLLLPASTSAAGKASDSAEIRALISTTYDQPDARVQTDPVIVVGDHAVADWTQGKRGGRALIRREQGKWEVVLCAGDGLRHAETMVQAGVPAATAKTMAQKLSQAEKPLPTSRRQQFDLFGTSNNPATGTHTEHPDHAHAQHPAHSH